MLAAGITHVLDLRTEMEASEAAEVEGRCALRRHEGVALSVSKVSLINTRKKASRLFRVASWRQRGLMLLGLTGLLDAAALHGVVSGLLLNAGLLGMYVEICTDCQAELRECFEALLLAAGKGATVVHCTSGKDRTGLIVALLLSSAGVEDADVVEDYAITEEPVYSSAPSS